ncbi:unnamed protein product, partial [Owenia fusiformis]
LNKFHKMRLRQNPQYQSLNNPWINILTKLSSSDKIMKSLAKCLQITQSKNAKNEKSSYESNQNKSYFMPLIVSSPQNSRNQRYGFHVNQNQKKNFGFLEGGEFQ